MTAIGRSPLQLQVGLHGRRSSTQVTGAARLTPATPLTALTGVRRRATRRGLLLLDGQDPTLAPTRTTQARPLQAGTALPGCRRCMRNSTRRRSSSSSHGALTPTPHNPALAAPADLGLDRAMALIPPGTGRAFIEVRCMGVSIAAWRGGVGAGERRARKRGFGCCGKPGAGDMGRVWRVMLCPGLCTCSLADGSHVAALDARTAFAISTTQPTLAESAVQQPACRITPAYITMLGGDREKGKRRDCQAISGTDCCVGVNHLSSTGALHCCSLSALVLVAMQRAGPAVVLARTPVQHCFGACSREPAGPARPSCFTLRPPPLALERCCIHRSHMH